MSNFMEGYEDVAARIKRWQIANPVGRIETEVVHHDTVKGQILAKASVFREHEDTLAAGVDYAFGDVTNYPQSMRKWYVEDTVTSAIGRAISLVLETDKKPTAQDMAKVEYVNKREADSKKPFAEKLAAKITVENVDDPWTIKPINEAPPAVDAVQLVKDVLGGKTQEDIPSCKHGEMVWKHGVSSKNKKPWGQFRCIKQGPAGPGAEAFCEPIWYMISDDGSWKPQVKW